MAERELKEVNNPLTEVHQLKGLKIVNNLMDNEKIPYERVIQRAPMSKRAIFRSPDMGLGDIIREGAPLPGVQMRSLPVRLYKIEPLRSEPFNPITNKIGQGQHIMNALTYWYRRSCTLIFLYSINSIL